MHTGQTFKWIELRPGVYKTVSLSDDRPAAHLPDKKGIPNIVSKQSWIEAGEKLLGDPSTMTPLQQQRANEVYLAERSKETATSANARNWEAGRKKAWYRNKPAYMKQVKEKEKSKVDKVTKEVANKFGL